MEKNVGNTNYHKKYYAYVDAYVENTDLQKLFETTQGFYVNFKCTSGRQKTAKSTTCVHY